MKSNQERSNECLPPKKREIPASTISSGSSEERPLVVAQAGDGQRGENLAWLASVVSVHEGREQRTSTSTSTSTSVSPSSHDADGPQYKPLPSSDYSSSSSSSSSAVTSTSSHSTRGLPLGLTTLPATYASSLSQPGGAIQYTHLPPSVHFIAPPYAGPYAGYISPLGPPPPPPPPPPPTASHHRTSSSSSTSGETNATNSSSSSSSSSSKLDQHHHSHSHHHHQHHQHQQQQQQQSKASDPAIQTHSTRTSSATTSVHGPVHPHPHHHQSHPHHHQHHQQQQHHGLGALTGSAQLVLQYSDPTTSAPGPKKEVMNGELERSRNRFGPSSYESKVSGGGTKGGSSTSQEHQQHHYETRHHVVLPAEYDGAGLRTSLMLVPNSHGGGGGGSDPVGGADKLPSAGDKGGICAGKPVTRTPSSSSSSSSHPFLPPPPLTVDGLKGAPTVIQASHGTTTDALSLAGFYPAQQPIIGYIAGTAAHPGAQTALGYHPGPLPPHLLTQPLIIPVSTAALDPTAGVAVTAVSSSSIAATAHTFIAPAAVPPKGEATFEAPAPVPFPHPQHPHHHHHHHGGQVVQTQLHLPLVHTPAGLLASTHAPPPPPPVSASHGHTHPNTHPLPPPPPPSLPAYFAKGSIIQLADGELKRVEELSTEDFLQSADISADLRIDSSTVERIATSLTPDYAIIQFAVGEHRAQVNRFTGFVCVCVSVLHS